MRIIDGLLRSVFEIKDPNRTFSLEQRRLIWHSAEQKKCQFEGCNKVLTWDDFTIDHIDAHSRGGLSEMENAAIMCREHNSSKNKSDYKKKDRPSAIGSTLAGIKISFYSLFPKQLQHLPKTLLVMFRAQRTANIHLLLLS